MVTFEGFDGEQFTVEIPGQDIVDALRRDYALERAWKSLDNWISKE